MISRVELEQKLAVLNAQRHKQGGLSYAQSFEAQQLQNQINAIHDDTPQRPAKIIRKTYDALEAGMDFGLTGNYYLETSAGATGPTGHAGSIGPTGVVGPTGVDRFASIDDVPDLAAHVYTEYASGLPTRVRYGELSMYPHRLTVKEARSIAGPSHGCTTG